MEMQGFVMMVLSLNSSQCFQFVKLNHVWPQKQRARLNVLPRERHIYSKAHQQRLFISHPPRETSLLLLCKKIIVTQPTWAKRSISFILR